MKKNLPKPKLFLTRVLSWIALRPRSIAETKSYIECALAGKKNIASREKELYSAQVEPFLKYLINNRLLDDRKFAVWFLESRLRTRPRSHSFLKAELVKKGIDKELIEQVLQGVTYEAEIKIAFRSIQKLLPRLSSLDPYKRKRRIIGYLSRRGFSWGIIRIAIDRIEAETVQ